MNAIIFVDIDGTLKDKDGNISENTKSVIKQIQNKGIEVVVTTGRPRYHALKIRNLIESSKYIISSNGAEIYDCNKKEVINLEPINNQDVIHITDKIINNGGRYALNILDKEIVSDTPKNSHQIVLDKELPDLLSQNSVKQIFIKFDDVRAARDIYNYISSLKDIIIINESTFFKSNVVEDKGIWFTVTHSNVNKGNAIKYLCNHLGIGIEDTYGIGNDGNDIDMFKVVNCSIAMENASDDIKKMATIIADSNDKDGVATILRRLFLKESE